MKKLLGIVLLTITLDAMVNAFPGAHSIYNVTDSMPAHEQYPVRNFFSAFGFFSVTYFISVIPIYLVLAGLYALVIHFVDRTAINSILLGLVIALAFYLPYAFIFSVESSFSYFYYRVGWYAFLGGGFGWLFYRIVPKI
jgi:uncharacterized membrane protein